MCSLDAIITIILSDAEVKVEGFNFQNAEQVEVLLKLVETDENGLYKTLSYNTMCVLLFQLVTRESFEQLIHSDSQCGRYR